MNNIEILNEQGNYNICITNDKKNIENTLKIYMSSKDNSYVIIDKNVYEKHYFFLNKLMDNISNNKFLILYIDEKEKNYKTLEKIYDFLINNDCTREGILVSIGGGVLGDLVGMAASTYMRGIRYINIPTTIISQTDSSIGGKVAYNYRNIKNLIGDFYSPSLVIINVDFLNTLSEKQYINGLGEVIKYSFLDRNINLLDYLINNKEKIKNKNTDVLNILIRKCLLIKKDYVERDFKDGNIRNSLNLGHTIGHGIEAITDYNILHGEAVALGLLGALKLSNKKYEFPMDFYDKAKYLMEFFNLRTTISIENFKFLIDKIKKDKKNDFNIRFVLLKKIGEPIIKVPITEEEIVGVIQETIKENE